MKNIILLLMIFIVTACQVNKNEVAGLYTVKNQLNTIDTLKILAGGEYVRILRVKSKRIVFKNTDKWNFADGRITLRNYLLDNDDTYSSGVVLDDVTITSSLPMETRFGKIIIYYRQDEENQDNHYYEKQ